MNSAKILRVCVTFLVAGSLVSSVNSGNTGADGKDSVLYLLNVVPYNDSRPLAGWDRGLELIPAGEIATEEINNRTDILPGFRLQLLHIDSEACGHTRITDGLVNWYRHLIDPSTTVVGVVGLVCSSVTDVLVPIADHPNISFLEIAGSNSPRHRNRDKYPLLFHTTSSSISYNKAVSSIMELSNWHRISLVYDSLGIYYISTADDFFERINTQWEVVSQDPIRITSNFLKPAFNSLRRGGGRIVYAVVTELESAMILCQAYKHDYTWPRYAYIFIDKTVESILSKVKGLPCTEAEVKEAMEGVFLLNSKLKVSQDTRLVSGKTYDEFYTEYKERITALLGNISTTPYANVLYDQVWAFGLALNSSLPVLDSLGINISKFHFGDSKTTDILAEHLENVSFQGAAGIINFNSMREAEIPVEIYQVQSNKAVLVGNYYQDKNLIIFTSRPNAPADHFDSVYMLLPRWLAAVIFTVCGLCYVLTTINLFAYLYWRKAPHIIATSPYLSLHIFLGCYLLYTAALVRTVYHSTFVENSTLFVVLCTSVIWLSSTGLNLIYATLFVKLLRVYYVFSHFRRTSKFWSDPFLCLGSLFLCLGGIVILLVWTSVDPSHQDLQENYVDAEPQPYYEIRAVCVSKYIQLWLAAAFTYSGVIIALVTFLGVRTRNIKRQNFKDTKKVNVFVASTILVSGSAVPIFYLLNAVEEYVLAHIFLCGGFLLIAILCQIFLFVPKTLPLFRKSNRTTCRQRRVIPARPSTPITQLSTCTTTFN